MRCRMQIDGSFLEGEMSPHSRPVELVDDETEHSRPTAKAVLLTSEPAINVASPSPVRRASAVVRRVFMRASRVRSMCVW